MDHRTETGAKLRAIRITRQVRQVDLAKMVGVRSDTISHLERGDWGPSDLLAHRLALALGCKVEDFLVRKPAPLRSAEQDAA